MTPAELRQLADKFFEGETSADEEKTLRGQLQKMELPDDLTYLKDYFSTMEEASADGLDESFDKNLMEKLSFDEKKVSRRLIYTWAGIAATIILLLGFWFGPGLMNTKEPYGTIHDPAVAFSESRQILDEVAEKMKKGIKPAKKTVDKVESNLQKTRQVKKLDEALEKAKPLHKIDDASELLKSFSKIEVVYGKS